MVSAGFRRCKNSRDTGLRLRDARNIIFATVTTAPNGDTQAGSGVMTGSTKEQLLKHSILSERSPYIALKEFCVHIIDANPMVREILAPLTNRMATILTDEAPQVTIIDDV